MVITELHDGVVFRKKITDLNLGRAKVFVGFACTFYGFFEGYSGLFQKYRNMNVFAKMVRPFLIYCMTIR